MAIRFWRSEREHTAAAFVQPEGRHTSQQITYPGASEKVHVWTSSARLGCEERQVKALYDCGCSVGSERRPRGTQQSLAGVPSPPVTPVVLTAQAHRVRWLERSHSAACSIQSWPVAVASCSPAIGCCMRWVQSLTPWAPPSISIRGGAAPASSLLGTSQLRRLGSQGVCLRVRALWGGEGAAFQRPVLSKQRAVLPGLFRLGVERRCFFLLVSP